MSHHQRLDLIFFMLVMLVTPGASSAGEPLGADEPGLVLYGADGEKVAINVVGGEVTVVSERDGETSLHIVDLSQIGTLLDGSVQDVLATLADMQMNVHAGNDNRFDFSHGDATWEVDVDAIMTQVGTMLAAGFGELDTGDWSNVHQRDRTEEDLRTELGALKRELGDLKRELRKAER